MTICAFIYAVAFVVYFSLAVIVVMRNHRALLNWLCALLLACFGLWAFADIYHHMMPRILLEQAVRYGDMGTPAYFGFAAVFLLFALALTNRQKYLRSWLTYVPVVGIPLTFIAFQLTGRVMFHEAPGRFGWVAQWTPSIWTGAFVVYYASASILGLYLVFHFGRVATQPRQRRQALIIFWTGLAALVLGTLNDMVLSPVTRGGVPEMAGAMVLIWAVGLAVSMTRYGLTTFTVQAAADKILATMPDVLLLLDPDGKIVTVNQAAFDLLGYPMPDLAGQPASKLFDQRSEFEHALQQLLARRSLSGVVVNARARAGRTIPMAVTARTMQRYDGSLQGSVWLLRDITQLRQAQQTLRESEEKYRNLVERANDGIIIVQDGRVTFANRRMTEMSGQSLDQIIGSPIGDHIHPDARAEVEDRYRRRIAGETVPATYESALLTSDGCKVPAEMNAGLITYQGRSADLVIIRDITERKKAEDEIRAKSERLELVNRDLDAERRKLLALTEDLTRANDDLKRLSEAKSEFVAAASHDLRTPLTTIIEGILLVEDGSLGVVNQEQVKFLRYAREDALRLAELIGSVLDVAKIERGGIKPNKTKVDVAGIVNRMRETYGSYAQDKGLTFTVELPAEPPYVLCDTSHYERVLANMVSNAIKFTPAGGSVWVKVARGSDPVAQWPSGPVKTLDHSTTRPLDHYSMVLTSVCDTGLGIPLEHQHRIFGKFEQIERHDGGLPSGGTGLGLALCKQLVELNGGTIGFESVENQGSTFYFALPAWEENKEV
jgi:PAS domain S-box-containing protein